jgi:hypothetical protein
MNTEFMADVEQEAEEEWAAHTSLVRSSNTDGMHRS